MISTVDRTHLDRPMLWSISILGRIHVLFGIVEVADGILYDWEIVPLIEKDGDLYILKMDQVVHFLGYGVVAVALHQLIAFRACASTHWTMIAFLAWVAAMGVGAINEVVEYLASESNRTHRAGS